MRQLLRELMSNPVALRDAGLDFCPRRLGLHPGKWRLLTVGMLWVLAFAPAVYYLFKWQGVLTAKFEAALIAMMGGMLLVFVPMSAFTMSSSARAFSVNETDHLEELLVTPLSPLDLVRAKVLARGFPAIATMLLLWTGGVVAALVVFGKAAFRPEFLRSISPDDSEILHLGLWLFVSGVMIVELYLRGCLASLRLRYGTLVATANFARSWAVYLALGGLLFGWHSMGRVFLHGKSNGAFGGEQLLVVVSLTILLVGACGFMWFRMRAFYEDLTGQLRELLWARLEGGTRG